MLKLLCIWHYFAVIALKGLSSRGEGSQNHRRQRGKTLLLCRVKSGSGSGNPEDTLQNGSGAVAPYCCLKSLVPGLCGLRLTSFCTRDKMALRTQGLAGQLPFLRRCAVLLYFIHIFSGAAKAVSYSVNSWAGHGQVHCIVSLHDDSVYLENRTKQHFAG